MTTVVGADKFYDVAKRLRGAADRKDLIKEMRTGITRAVPALRNAVKADAPDYLPDNYAAELVPSLRFRTNTTTGGTRVTVNITVSATGQGGNARQVGDLEDGDLRHPVFGRTRALRRHAVHRATSMANPWVNQRVTPNFVTEPMEKAAPVVRKEIEAAVDRVLTKITGG